MPFVDGAANGGAYLGMDYDRGVTIRRQPGDGLSPWGVVHLATGAWLVAGSVMAALLLAPAAARAGDAEPPTAAVLQTTASDGRDAGTAGSIERVVRARLDALTVVRVTGTPALGLADLQLAVGCMGETAACLRAVAEQVGVDALILSHLDRAGDGLMLTITHFDARQGKRSSVVRRDRGPGAANRLVGGVDAQLRELFKLPPPVAREDGAGLEGDRGRSPLPFVVLGTGVAALAAGGVLGFVSRRTHDDYASTEVRTVADAEHAQSLLARSERQARAAHALFGVGGGLVLTGVVLLVVMRPRREEPGVAVTPALGPTVVGLQLSGRFGEGGRR
jgi:hypothetical protein